MNTLADSLLSFLQRLTPAPSKDTTVRALRDIRAPLLMHCGELPDFFPGQDEDLDALTPEERAEREKQIEEEEIMGELIWEFLKQEDETQTPQAKLIAVDTVLKMQ